MAVLEDSTMSSSQETPNKPAKNTKKVLLVAQELKLARVLSGNNKGARDRALKSLRKWFKNRAATIPFSEDDFLRLWKGLFYSMWMSDKPLVQEECAENIANLMHSLPWESALLFYKCSTITLLSEWFGIDQFRIDKFMMFVRRLLRQVLFVLKNADWGSAPIRKFKELLAETILEPQKQKPVGLLMHFSEIFLEELSKVADGALPPQVMGEFVKPFVLMMAYAEDSRIRDHIRKFIFIDLMRQSDLGLEYTEKYSAWKKIGFPGSINAMTRVEDEDEEVDDEEEEEGEKIYDPRAGRVNVELPQLQFHPKAIAKALLEHKFDKATNSRSRKLLTDLADNFRKLAANTYPLGVKKVKTTPSDNVDTNIRKAVNRLVKFDRKIMGKKRKATQDQVELRNGKKVRLNTKLEEKLQEEFDFIMSQKQASQPKKRKITTVPTVKAKVRRLEPPKNALGSFSRFSGTWFVSEKETVEVPKEDTAWAWSAVPDTKATPRLPTIARKSLPAILTESPKKVKINLKLNRSQDLHEHHCQILSSPAIPYDANRKPIKTLLKRKVGGPINPFYRRPKHI